MFLVAKVDDETHRQRRRFWWGDVIADRTIDDR